MVKHKASGTGEGIPAHRPGLRTGGATGDGGRGSEEAAAGACGHEKTRRGRVSW